MENRKLIDTVKEYNRDEILIVPRSRFSRKSSLKIGRVINARLFDFIYIYFREKREKEG